MASDDRRAGDLLSVFSINIRSSAVSPKTVRIRTMGSRVETQ